MSDAAGATTVEAQRPIGRLRLRMVAALNLVVGSIAIAFGIYVLIVLVALTGWGPLGAVIGLAIAPSAIILLLIGGAFVIGGLGILEERGDGARVAGFAAIAVVIWALMQVADAFGRWPLLLLTIGLVAANFWMARVLTARGTSSVISA